MACILVTWSVLVHILQQTQWPYASKKQLVNYIVILRLYCVGDIFQAPTDQDTGCMVNEAAQSMEAEISVWI